uniref:DUF834 domain-containing protein n=1 Tax=Oryza rufipogon TaxID=4529 RepID=A0A0E0RA55_ORYRU
MEWPGTKKILTPLNCRKLRFNPNSQRWAALRTVEAADAANCQLPRQGAMATWRGVLDSVRRAWLLLHIRRRTAPPWCSPASTAPPAIPVVSATFGSAPRRAHDAGGKEREMLGSLLGVIRSEELAGISLAPAVKMAGFGQGGAGCGDSVPVVGGGEAGDGGQELEAAAATPANSGVGGGPGEHQWSEMSLRVATAEARVAWSSASNAAGGGRTGR